MIPKVNGHPADPDDEGHGVLAAWRNLPLSMSKPSSLPRRGVSVAGTLIGGRDPGVTMLGRAREAESRAAAQVLGVRSVELWATSTANWTRLTDIRGGGNTRRTPAACSSPRWSSPSALTHVMDILIDIAIRKVDDRRHPCSGEPRPAIRDPIRRPMWSRTGTHWSRSRELLEADQAAFGEVGYAYLWRKLMSGGMARSADDDAHRRLRAVAHRFGGRYAQPTRQIQRFISLSGVGGAAANRRGGTQPDCALQSGQRRTKR